jgi:hypothetical protein
MEPVGSHHSQWCLAVLSPPLSPNTQRFKLGNHVAVILGRFHHFSLIPAPTIEAWSSPEIALPHGAMEPVGSDSSQWFLAVLSPLLSSNTENFALRTTSFLQTAEIGPVEVQGQLGPRTQVAGAQNRCSLAGCVLPRHVGFIELWVLLPTGPP